MASYGFCGYISTLALISLLLSTLIVYAGGLAIEKYHKRSGLIATLTIFLFAFSIIGIKNIPFFVKFFNIGNLPEDHILRSLVLPIGFSFYAFQAIGYIYDIYKKKEKAERDLVFFALYMGFFAKLISGPIERAGSFRKEVDKLSSVKILNVERLSTAIIYILWGYALKLIVADRLALIVNQLHSTPVFYDSLWLAGGAVMYSFQVYTDFAGYTFIALGCARLFGIELTNNFFSPYCSKNVTEFWRRWHISLSSWLRDYLYIPLGGNRKGTARKCLNTLIVFIICGIWHGNGISFVIWGLLHGLYSIWDSIAGKKITEGNFIKTIFGRMATFIAVTFAWIFFRAESTKLAFEYIRLMFTGGWHPTTAVGYLNNAGISMLQVYIAIALIIVVELLDILAYNKKLVLPELISRQNAIVRYIFCYVCIIAIFIIGIYGGDFKTEEFIYMQF